MTAVGLGLAALTACSASPAPPAPPPPAASRTVVPVPSQVFEHPGHRTVLPGRVDDAELGVTYEFSVFAHCGGRYTSFDSRSWDAGRNPFDAGGSLGYVPGVMTLVADALARFETGDTVVDYRPLVGPQPLCV
ncbi:hypothetical protein GCM10023215_46690 [Pseudonocardia yuanmonensis]|uniref:Uncharacterized protein n=1 Tax=Pseudonocardia yuanmonensis TaxID=1095914 RepID=A0ABP8X805_9PSEU